jgi:hypothetical protein
MAFGAVLECSQGLVGRTPDALDFAADVAGIACATCLWLVIQRRRDADGN